MIVAFDFDSQEVTVEMDDGRTANVTYDSYHAAVQHVRADEIFNSDVSRMFDERVGQLILETAEREAGEAIQAVASISGPVPSNVIPFAN